MFCTGMVGLLWLASMLVGVANCREGFSWAILRTEAKQAEHL
jgi:hypothetical protein